MALCVLSLSVMAASAAQAEVGQTAFTCAPINVGGIGYSDAHCDDAVAAGETYKAVEFAAALPTDFTVTNSDTANKTLDNTPISLHVPMLHGVVNVSVTCSDLDGAGVMKNTEKNINGVMTAEGSAEMEIDTCTTSPSTCEVVAPIIVKAKAHLTEVAADNGMGLKVEPAVGASFTTLTFKGAACPLRLFPNIPVVGNATGTPSGNSLGHGATTRFDGGPMQSVTVGGVASELNATVTFKADNGSALIATTD
jgi:hypothetical protein